MPKYYIDDMLTVNMIYMMPCWPWVREVKKRVPAATANTNYGSAVNFHNFSYADSSIWCLLLAEKSMREFFPEATNSTHDRVIISWSGPLRSVSSVIQLIGGSWRRTCRWIRYLARELLF